MTSAIAVRCSTNGFLPFWSEIIHCFKANLYKTYLSLFHRAFHFQAVNTCCITLHERVGISNKMQGHNDKTG